MQTERSVDVYNRRLDTFLAVAEAGSFTAAARNLFISPSAVLQQMDALEKDLGAALFHRTSQGTQLTEAGKFLRQEAEELIRRSRSIRTQMENFQQQNNIIRIGMNNFYDFHYLYHGCFGFLQLHPDYRIQTQMIPNDEILLHPEIDLIEGIHCTSSWREQFDFVKLASIPFCLSVSPQHPLGQRALLDYADLAGLSIACIEKGLDLSADSASEELIRAGAKVTYVSGYTPSVVLHCAVEGYALLMPRCWAHNYDGLVTVPVNWPHTTEYGIFLSKHAISSARELADYLQRDGHWEQPF